MRSCFPLLLVSLAAFAAERPAVTKPRATSGDAVSQPDWQERLTVTVGPSKADIIGTNQKAIQAGVDYVARLGGGTVKLLPGTYRLRNAVYLASKVRIVGSGVDTVLIKEPSVTTKLGEDSDWYDQEVTLADAHGFKIGDGVCLRATDAKTDRATVIKRTLTARSGNRFLLDKALRENLWQLNNATASTLFPILTGEFIEDVTIEDLVLDGNREHNDRLDGNYAGCIFLQDCNRITMRGVTARNYNGDGISWQICHDVLVENCTSENNADLGLHPGSGSQRPIIRNNLLCNNGIGIFFCWGGEVWSCGKESHRGQSHWHLHRSSRHRQPHHRQRGQRQQSTWHSVPTGARTKFCRASQPHRRQHAAEQRPRRWRCYRHPGWHARHSDREQRDQGNARSCETAGCETRA